MYNVRNIEEEKGAFPLVHSTAIADAVYKYGFMNKNVQNPTHNEWVGFAYNTKILKVFHKLLLSFGKW